LSENLTSLDYTNVKGFHINPGTEAQVVENVEGVLKDVVAFRSLGSISIRRESPLRFSLGTADCTRSYRPDILIIRDDQFVCGCVEVKRPLFFKDGMFPTAALGQVYTYLIGLRSSGVLNPLALLTDYNNWVVCALPDWTWSTEIPRVWDASDFEKRKWPQTGVSPARLFLHTLVSEKTAMKSLGVPVTFSSTDTEHRAAVFKVADFTSALTERRVLVSLPVSVDQKDKLLEQVGSFLVHCLFCRTASENLTRVRASGREICVPSAHLSCGPGGRRSTG
jgi:hypothetical protein